MRYTDNIIILNETTVEKYSKDFENEKNFYKQNKHLKMPRVISYDPFILERIYARHVNESDYSHIIKNLNHLHESTKTHIISEQDIRIEIYDKLVKRNTQYVHREYINGIKIKTYEEALEFMKHVRIPLCYKCIIHGDPHFDNIFVRDDELIFIDPRGYFGNSILYGITEYDIAKVHFSLSGYNYFEHMNDYSFTNHIDIPIHEKAFDIDFFTHILLCSIWLGNSHAYKGDKFDMSKHFALYIFTLFCIKYNI